MGRTVTVQSRSKNKKQASWLGRLLKVQPGEGLPVLLVGGAILATEGGYWLGGNGVEGLVFARLGSNILPYLLMLKGVLAFLAITFYGRWLVQVNRRRMLFFVTGATVALLLVSRLAIALQPPDWFYFLLFPVSFVVPDLFMTQAWGLAGETFDSRQNKRLFPLISALGAIGVVAGNFLSYPLTQLIHSENLLLVWCALVGLGFSCLFIQRQRLDRAKAKRRTRSAAEKERVEQSGILESLRLGFAVVRYYQIIGLMVIGTTLTYILYWAMYTVFVTDVNAQFTQQYPDVQQRSDALTGFFGILGGCATLLSFLLGLLVVNRLFARFGVRNLVLVMPLTNLFSFGVVLLFGGFNVVVAARFFHLMMTEALGSSVNQTIYNLLPPETRETATPFNNQGISKQGGNVLAGLVLLLAVISQQLVLVIAVVLALVYLYVASRMRSLYRPSLVQLLREGQQNFFDDKYGETSTLLTTDPGANSGEDTLQAAIAGLVDSSEGTRRLSAELLGQMNAPEAVQPLMKTVLMDTSGEVRRTAIYSLVQLKAIQSLPAVAEALTDPEAPVRAEAAAALRQLGKSLDYVASHFLNRALQDRDPLVKREVALTLYNYGRRGEALYTLWEMGRAEDIATRREAAAAYGELKDGVLNYCLTDLLDDFQPEVRRQAALSLGQIKSNLAVKALLAAVEDNDFSVREEVAHALAELRQYSARPLLRYLFQSRDPDGAACALHALTLAKLEEKKLARRYSLEQQLQRRELVAAGSNRPRTALLPPGDPLNDGLGLDLSGQEQESLLQYGWAQLDYAARMAGFLSALSALDLALGKQAQAGGKRYSSSDLSVLLKSLKERYEATILRVVDVIGLLGDVEALALVANGLQAQGRKAARMRADAIETLENFGEQHLTPRLIDLLEGRDTAVLQARRPGRTMSDIIEEIWRERDAWLKACLIYVIGAFQLRRLRPLVAEAVMIEGQTDYLIEETGQEALKRLDRRETDLHLLIGDNLTPAQEAVTMQTLGTLSTMSRIILLQKVPIFANLRPEDLRRVALVCRERLFAPGDIICYEGDPGDELYIVVSGQVQVITGYGSDNSRTLAVNQEGEAVGMMAILDDIPRSATLRAANEPLRLLILGADEFKRILRERPEMAAEVIRVLSRLLRDTNRRVQESAALTDNLSQ